MICCVAIRDVLKSSGVLWMLQIGHVSSLTSHMRRAFLNDARHVFVGTSTCAERPSQFRKYLSDISGESTTTQNFNGSMNSQPKCSFYCFNAKYNLGARMFFVYKYVTRKINSFRNVLVLLHQFIFW